MTVKHRLLNDVSVKDETRLANANSKIGQGEAAIPYYYSDDVNTSIMCAVEENQTDSSVNMLTCSRNDHGDNCLAVSPSGFIKPTDKQITSCAVYESYTDGTKITYNTGPKNQYITGLIFSNLSAAGASKVQVSIQPKSVTTPTLLIEIIVPPSNSLILNPILLSFSDGDSLVLNTTSVTGQDNLTVIGFLE